jgi:hypothetical protein
MTGPGGTGKTRLASEACRRMRAQGWIAGMLRRGARGGSLATLAQVSGPLLIVVDYAETRVDQLSEVLEAIADAEAHGAKVRLLLVARNSGDWLTRLRQQLHDPRAEAAVWSVVTQRLRQVESDLLGRAQAFREAADAFASATQTPFDDLTEPDFADPAYDRLLFVHMAALGALHGNGGNIPTRRDELLAHVLEREARVWAETWHARDLPMVDEQVRRRAVAVATLTPAADELAATRALEAIPDLAGAQAEALRLRVARWLRDLYPGPHYLNPLEPDLLGEALVASVLVDLPELPLRLLSRA